MQEMLAAKRAANRREVYVKSLQRYLERFGTGRTGQEIGSFTSKEIEDWVAQFRSAHSRQTWLNRINTLFAFAVRRGYLEKNPCDRIERITIDHKPPVILTVEQANILLSICPASCKPWLVLTLFAGVRPDGEAMKLKWADVNLETKTVKINFPKVRRHRRIVPLEPRAVSLLGKISERGENVSPSNSTVRRFKRSARSALGFTKWPQDVLRHTAASYLLALHKDAGKVAHMLGNSAAILLTHYHEPVTQLDMERFWTI